MSSTSKDGEPHQKKDFRCSMCRVTCLSEVSFQAHNRGAKHLKALRSCRDYQYQKPPKKLTSLKDFINDPSRNEPLIGLMYVEEGQKVKGKRHYRCTLCELDMAMQIMFDHLIGHKHRRSYLNKHFPLLIKGVQTPTVAVLKKLAKEVEEEEGLQTYATNVPIKLKPQQPKKRAQNSSEQPAPDGDTTQPMQTNADEVIENMADTPVYPLSSWDTFEQDQYKDSSETERYSSSRDSENSSRRHRDYSPSEYKKSEGSSRSSSRDDYSSKRHRDYSPPQYKKSSREPESQSKRHRDYSPPSYKKHESTSKRSSSRESDYVSKRDRDHSPPQYQSSSKYSSSERKEKAVEYSPQTASSVKHTEESRSAKTYDSGSRYSSSGYSKDEPAKTYDSTSRQSSSGYNREYADSARTHESGSRSSSSGYSREEESGRTYESGSQHTSSGYNKDYTEPARTYESGSSHSSSGYNYNAQQGSSGVLSSQQTASSGFPSFSSPGVPPSQQPPSSGLSSYTASGVPSAQQPASSGFTSCTSSGVPSSQQTASSGTANAGPGGLSPDILKILQGKDVPTVTSILNRLSQYYPPLQNVDISLLVSVLFESGALK